MAAERLILHADMDAFYASIEIRDHAELEGRPVIVGGLSGRGVVSAASYAARRFGVHSAMPMFEARRLCPDGVFLAPNMSLYAAVSAQVHRVFEEISPDIESLALDEAFLDITHSLALFGTPLDIGKQLKCRVAEVTRLRVSVGIASSKLVAKIACTSGKPDGLVLVEQGREQELLFPLPIRRLWGIGPVSASALERRGIRTIGQLANYQPRDLEDIFGTRSIEVVELANGRDPRPVEVDRDPKSCGEECTFESDVVDLTRIMDTISAHSEAVARRLRRDEREGKTITLKIKLARAMGAKPDRNRTEVDAPVYPLVTRARSLRHYTSDGAEIRRVVVSLWDQLSLGEPIRLLGVAVSGLRSTGRGQLDLFGDSQSSRRLGATMDAIEARFGHGAIRRGAVAPDKLTPSGTRKRGQ